MLSRIKKYKNNKYVRTNSGVWVRDFTQETYPIDINHLTKETDFKLLISNELSLKSLNMMSFDDEKLYNKNCIIVSDGFDFVNSQKYLQGLFDCFVFGTNGALKKWDIRLGKMDRYIINNPYEECINFLPINNNYYPPCITSIRTNPSFIKKYKSTLYKYTPTYEEYFSNCDKCYNKQVDDYKNPICAAIHIAFILGFENILLFCCDDSFPTNKPGSIKVNDVLYTYPQQIIVNEIIDVMAGLIKSFNNNIKIGDCSSGLSYKNIVNINKDKIKEFFDII